MKIRTVDQLDLSGKRTLIRVDFNVPMDKAGNVTDDTRLAGGAPHDPAGDRAGGEDDPALPPRAPQGETAAGDEPGAGRAAPVAAARAAGRVRAGLRGRAGGEGRGRDEARGRPAPRERALPGGGGEERRGAGQTARRPLRRLRQRRLRHGASGTLLQRGHRQVREGARGRSPDEERDRLFREGARLPRPSAGGDLRRGEDLRKDRGDQQRPRQGGQDPDRRGDGEHLPRRAGLRDREIALRGRDGRYGEAGSRRGGGAEGPALSAGRRGGGRAARGDPRRPGPCRRGRFPTG